MTFRFGKSELTFIGMIIVFLFGLTNIIPSEISIYDQYLIPVIEGDIEPGDLFYPHINFLIVFLRLIIIVATFFDFYKAIKYSVRYHVFIK